MECRRCRRDKFAKENPNAMIPMNYISHTCNQPERLSPEDTKFVFRKPDGSVEPIRFLKYTDCVSDSPNSTNT